MDEKILIKRMTYIIFNTDDTVTVSFDIPLEDKDYETIIDLYEYSEPQFVRFKYNRDIKQLEEIEDGKL